MMQEWDPDGHFLSSIIVQDGVHASFSGATSLIDGRVEVAGVSGYGDEYMLGSQPPTVLPKPVLRDVHAVYEELSEYLGPVRLEWAWSNGVAWVLQVNQLQKVRRRMMGRSAIRWLPFDPSQGVTGLESLLSRLEGGRIGIRLSREVGLTSHIGDMLRASGVPVRWDTDEDPETLW